MFVRSGGSVGPILLLVHGLAANAEVWRGVITLAEQHWPGRWIAPDLRGHGRSPAASGYSYYAYAADLADLIEDDHPVTVLGHSMGGVVGLTLANGTFGVSVQRVIGVGIKVVWTDEEAAKMLAQAARPPAVFADRDAAVARGLRLAGLQGLVDTTSAVAAAGVVEDPGGVVEDPGGAVESPGGVLESPGGVLERPGSAVERPGGFRVAFDPAVNGVGPPPMAELLAAAQAEARLACGESDPMVSVGQLRMLDPSAVELPGLGHNAHVENPEQLWRTLMSPS